MATMTVQALSAHQVDLHRARATRLARLAQRLSVEGCMDDAIAVLDASIAARRLAEDSVAAWAEQPRSRITRRAS